MTQISLNKSSLSKQQINLNNYKHFLPSLDLKRRKLLAEKNNARSELNVTQQKLQAKQQYIANNFPMLAATDIDINQIVKIKMLQEDQENIVGVNLPILIGIEFEVAEYAAFNTPHWLDHFLAELKALLELRERFRVAEERIGLLEKAVQTVTQRSNLFEKVLIPNTEIMIRSIKIYLADSERASIVRSKIAKKKRQMQ